MRRWRGQVGDWGSRCHRRDRGYVRCVTVRRATDDPYAGAVVPCRRASAPRPDRVRSSSRWRCVAPATRCTACCAATKMHASRRHGDTSGRVWVPIWRGSCPRINGASPRRRGRRGTAWPSSPRRPAPLVRVPRSARLPSNTRWATWSDPCPCLSGLGRVDMRAGRGTADHLAPSPDAFEVGDGARGRRVLLLDDTWVTGARARSAAASLHDAGAHVVAVVVAGRSVGALDTAAVPAVAQWWRWAEARAQDGWSSSRPSCALARCLWARPRVSRDH
jgi:hypothetical protein